MPECADDLLLPYPLSPRLAAQRGAHTTQSSSPRRILKAQFRRRSSTSVASHSSQYRGRGRSRSNSHATRSRTQWTVLRCCVSASCNVASAGRLLGSSSGSWSVAGRWDIPASSPRRSNSFGSAYRMHSIARFRVGRRVRRRRARLATSRCISRGGDLSNTPAYLVPRYDAGHWASSFLSCALGFTQAVAHVLHLTCLCSLSLAFVSQSRTMSSCRGTII